MHLLKFTLEGGEPPSTIYCDETIGFGDSLSVVSTSLEIFETIGYYSIFPEGINEFIIDTIGFGESYPILSHDYEVYDTIGFYDSGDESLIVYCDDTIGFDDDVTQELSNNVNCVETIGFNEITSHEIYLEYDIIFTWRTRTNSYPGYGYGAAEYGSFNSYGDGNASNLAAFEIHIWKVGGASSNRYLNSNPVGEFSERLLVQSIPIVDTNDPDADATYTLTAANNKSLNGGVFLPEVEAEVFVKDSNGLYSFPKIIVVDTIKVYSGS